jgi:hypothetical protein
MIMKEEDDGFEAGCKLTRSQKRDAAKRLSRITGKDPWTAICKDNLG